MSTNSLNLSSSSTGAVVVNFGADAPITPGAAEGEKFFLTRDGTSAGEVLAVYTWDATSSQWFMDETVIDQKRTFYVDPNGLDTFHGKDIGQPKKTIAGALAAAGNGSTIIVCDGTYTADPAISITAQNITLTGQTPSGSGGVKTSVPAITATGIGPKISALQAASLTITHPAGNGAHTSSLQVAGVTSVISPAFYEDHGSKLVGNVTLGGAGAKYLYGTQFEGDVTVSAGSGLVALVDAIGDGGLLTIPAGVPYYLKNVSGLFLSIDPGAINIVDLVKIALSLDESVAIASVESIFTALRSEVGIHSGGRLSFDEVAVSNQAAAYVIPATTIDRTTSVSLAQTTAGVSMTLATPSDATVFRMVFIRNAGTASTNVNGVTLAPADATLWVYASGWKLVSGGSGQAQSVSFIAGADLSFGVAVRLSENGNVYPLDFSGTDILSTGTFGTATSDKIQDAVYVSATNQILAVGALNGAGMHLYVGQVSGNSITWNLPLELSAVNKDTANIKARLSYSATLNKLVCVYIGSAGSVIMTAVTRSGTSYAVDVSQVVGAASGIINTDVANDNTNFYVSHVTNGTNQLTVTKLLISGASVTSVATSTAMPGTPTSHSLVAYKAGYLAVFANSGSNTWLNHWRTDTFAWGSLTNVAIAAHASLIDNKIRAFPTATVGQFMVASMGSSTGFMFGFTYTGDNSATGVGVTTLYSGGPTVTNTRDAFQLGSTELITVDDGQIPVKGTYGSATPTAYASTARSAWVRASSGIDFGVGYDGSASPRLFYNGYGTLVSSRYPIIGITQAAALAAESVPVVTNGEVSSVHSGFTPGALVYASSTGALSTTTPSENIVGIALSASSLTVDLTLQRSTSSLTAVAYDAGTWKSAQANSRFNACEAIQLSDGSRITSGVVAWTAHGLVTGAQYYLSQTTAGGYTSTKPSSGSSLLQPLFYVADSNTIIVSVDAAVYVDGAFAASTSAEIVPQYLSSGVWTSAIASGETTLATMMKIGSTGSLLLQTGKVRFDSAHPYTVGSPVYLSQSTAGGLTSTRPTTGIVQQVGIAEDNRTLAISVEPFETSYVTAPLTIGAVTTSPTKPTTRTVDLTGYTMLHPRLAQVFVRFAWNNNAGSNAGNGQYLFALPSSLKFDTVRHPIYTGDAVSTGVNNRTIGLMTAAIPARGFMMDQVVNNTPAVFIVPWSQTQYRVLYIWSSGETTIVSSSYFPLNAGQGVWNFSFDISTSP